MTHQTKKYKYYAFISYSSRDIKWGKRLQQKLEHYRMPATLCRERGWKRTPINPIFFAPTDIQPGGLNEELKNQLQASKNLIVICSPNSAHSKWVYGEIAFFHNLGRTKQIHFFIVDGTPHSGNPETECFNPVIKELDLPEILGANIHEKVYRWPWQNRERAYIQLISKLLDVDFDAIWRRNQRLFVQKAIAWVIGIIAVIAVVAGVWLMNQPVNVKMQLHETSVRNNLLPPLKDAVVKITLGNETKTDTIRSMDATAIFTNIPHRFLNKPVKVAFFCRDYMDVDTTLLLVEHLTLNIRRNPSVYGDIHFLLKDPDLEISFGNTELEIEGNIVTSDENGYVSLIIPLELQKKVYSVKVAYPLKSDSLFTMPCGDDAALKTKLKN